MNKKILDETTQKGNKATLRTLLEIMLVSTKLGFTSFGGPIAHLGYFHNEYVRRRKWMDEKSYADLVWDVLRQNQKINNALMGVNAGVVGFLIAAFYQPIWTSSILSPLDFSLAAILFSMLAYWKLPPWIVVLTGIVAGFLFQ